MIERMKYIVVIDSDQICRMIISANLSKKYLGNYKSFLFNIPIPIIYFSSKNLC